MTEDRPCPICGAADPRIVAHQAFEALPGSLVDKYFVVCCRACGLAYASGLPSPEEFAAYYRGMSKYEHADTSGFTTPEDQARCYSIVDLVKAHSADRDVAVLDVGCSTGALLAAFKRGGFSNAQGLDPSPACAVFAREAYDIEVRTGTAADLAALSDRYGLIVLSAVLEHLLDPLRALRDAWGALVSGGLVFAEVPDVEGFAENARAPFQEFSVEHINFFSRLSLASIMGMAGFEPVVVQRLQIRWQSETLNPAIHAVFRKTGSPMPWTQDDMTEAAVQAYVAKCNAIEAEVRSRIRGLADRSTPVLVWGVGTHTRHLLQTGSFDGLKIAAWIDSDPKYVGAEMRGVPVLAPHDVSGRDEAILISSGTVHHEIVRQIRENLGLHNEIVLLYD